MTDPTANISSVLRKVRMERGLTLEETANLTGVSKTMLGQIERGASNPTISILWKISSGLRIPFSGLLSSPEQELTPIRMDQMTPVLESNGKMILYNIFPFDPMSGFDYFHITLLPGASHVSSPHGDSAMEYVVVTQGTLRLKVGEAEFDLKAPAALEFRGDQMHGYSNPMNEPAVFQNIVKY